MAKDKVRVVNKQGIAADKALRLASDNYLAQVQNKQVRRMEQAAIVVEGQAKRNIKRYKDEEDKLIDTGRMINSVTHEVDSDIPKRKIVGVVGTNVKIYPAVHELGSSKVPPRPWLRPALIQTKDDVNSILANGLNDAARAVDKK